MKIKKQKPIEDAYREQRAQLNFKNQEEQLEILQRSKVIEAQGIEYHDKESFKKNYEIMMHRGKAFLCSIDILKDPNLSSNAKVLFYIISMMSLNEGYCWTSSVYLSAKMGTGKGSVNRYLDELEKYGLIKRDTYKIREGWRRNIYIQFQYIKDLYFKRDKTAVDSKLSKKSLKPI